MAAEEMPGREARARKKVRPEAEEEEEETEEEEEVCGRNPSRI